MPQLSRHYVLISRSDPPCHGSKRKMVTYIFSFLTVGAGGEIFGSRPQQGGAVLSCGWERLQTSKNQPCWSPARRAGRLTARLGTAPVTPSETVLLQRHTLQLLRCRNYIFNNIIPTQ